MKQSHIKFKPTHCYRESPLTGAQFEFLPEVVSHRHDDYWRLTFKIALPAILLGQNMVIADADHVGLQLAALSRFIMLFLLASDFAPKDVRYFNETARIESVELAWHVACKSLKAARGAQLRIFTHLKELATVDAQAYAVEKVSFTGENDDFTFYGHAQGGSQLKCYLKSQQARSRKLKDRKTNFLSGHMRQHRSALLSVVATDVRLEAILEREMLAAHGLDEPRNWSTERALLAIDDLWEKLGLLKTFAGSVRDIATLNLHPNVQNTVRRYCAGEDPRSFLTKSARSRHGAILRQLGLEIDIPWATHKKNLSATIGKQLRYEKRNRFSSAALQFTMTREYLTTLIARFDRWIAIRKKDFSQEAHDMREQERSQHGFMKTRKDQFVNDETKGPWKQDFSGADKKLNDRAPDTLTTTPIAHPFRQSAEDITAAPNQPEEPDD